MYDDDKNEGGNIIIERKGENMVEVKLVNDNAVSRKF